MRWRTRQSQESSAAAIKRREDPALITGKGRYTDDFTLPHMAHAVIVRSPYAHAHVRGIDTSEAARFEGVLAVYTAAEIEASDAPGTVPTAWLLPDIKTPEHPLLAKERVRYVGDGVAVVVAESRLAARQAAELVEVDYDPLDAVVDAVKATASGAPQLFEDAPGNISFDWDLGDKDKTGSGFRGRRSQSVRSAAQQPPDSPRHRAPGSPGGFRRAPR